MSRLNVGETAVISLVVKALDYYGNIGAQVNPSNIPQITITNPSGTVVINAASMSLSATGLYYYNYPVPAAVYGQYDILFSVTDGTLVTEQRESFIVGR